jgi:rRNA maturation protein Nop10
MGDRYSWNEKCPKCGRLIDCYYAESCEMTTARCPWCGERYNIVMDFILVPEKKHHRKKGV